MKKIDCSGLACPLPVVNAKKELEGMKNDTLKVTVDNDIAVQNLKRLSKSLNCEFSYKKESDTLFNVYIEKGESEDTKINEQDYTCEAPQNKKSNTLVVISSNTMGNGDDELGKILMKGFIFALTQMDDLPNTVILYNGGAFLSTEDSQSLEDLKNLEKCGVEIMTCGTCLNHYGIADKLQVGTVSNMYAIAESMTKADKIIRP